MDESDEWVARSSTSRGFNTACVGSSTSLGPRRGRGGVEAEEDEEDLNNKVALSRKRPSVTGKVCSGVCSEVSLREWLDRPDRPVELLECLHIFRQVVEAVSLAHAEGVVITNIRPSCFILSSFNRVAFIESASCSTSGSDSFEDDVVKNRAGGSRTYSDASCPRRSSVEEAEEERYEIGSKENEKKEFPLKQILLMEFNWYTSPEEAAGSLSTFASDIYRLGVLLFELFCTFDSLEEKLRTMSNLRHRVLPPELLLKWPKQASFCLWLLHPQPNTRPKMSEVLQSEFLNEPRDSLEEREAAINLKEEIEDQELLLDFLVQLQQRKQETADHLQETISLLSSDIEDVHQKQSILHKKRELYFQSKEEEDTVAGKLDPLLPHASIVHEESASSGSRKRYREGFKNPIYEEHDENLNQGPNSGLDSDIKENVVLKSSRLMKNFNKLEAAYFSTRCRSMKPSSRCTTKKLSLSSSGRGSIARTEASSVDDLASKEAQSTGCKSDWINTFLEGLCKYLSYSKLTVRADLKQGDLLNSSGLVCSLGFDRDREFFATAGVNRKIKVFDCDMLLNDERDIHYPVVEMASRSKLSSICWNAYIKNQIASSNFEGVVQIWDVTRSNVLMDMREHERRVWSVDFSLTDPTKLASGSDDGAVKLWNINQEGSICTIKTKANVCSVQFPPDSARSIAIGSADHNIYIYDFRNTRAPLCTVSGHSKTVSYVKFIDSTTLVSASTDNSLKLWDLSTSTCRALDTPIQTFTGHTNVKNFVGLSVSDGYIATGSETNEVFVYHKAFPMPVLSYKFNAMEHGSVCEADDPMQFISCVCWRGQSPTLLAANSSGDIKLLEMAS